ncbi:trimethylamine methyltransferase family protein [Desulfitobacterium hafniense]|nr:trimethylamine methyltransferase family protein [Desulfitobacterium hafniense]
MKLNYEFAAKSELDLIHEKTLKLLAEIGVVFESEKAVDVFKAHGARTEGKTVFISEKMLTGALETVPRSFTWEGRKSSVEVGKGSISIPAYGPIYLYQNNEITDITPQDFVNFHKLHETSDVIQAANPNVMEPAQVPKLLRAKYQMATALLYSTKPCMGLVSGEEDARMSIQLTKRFYGRDKANVLLGLINTAAPLHVGKDMCEALMVYAEEGQGQVIVGGGISGLTAPPSLASMILIANAASLAGIVLAQLVNPGTPVVYSISGSGADLRYNVPAVGNPECALYSMLNRDMRRYYKVPVRGGGLLTDAKQIDYQCGYETFMSGMATYVADCDIVIHACGIMDTFNTISYEKFMLDEELTRSLKWFLKGISITEDEFCYDLIKQKGPGGHFMGRTTKMFRDNFIFTEIANKDSVQNWAKSGKQTVEERAAKAYKKRLEEYILPEMTQEQFALLKENIPAELLREKD